MKIIIFAGGNGTRLWPVSRIKTPKQFSPLMNNGVTLFELTVERMKQRFDEEDIIVVVPEIYVKEVRKIYPKWPDERIIVEPYKWDTLACIGFAGFVMEQRFPNENLFLVWSDHTIKNAKRFLDIVVSGDKYATKHKKVIKIGAKTTYPETNWGYIEFGDQIEDINGVQFYSYLRHYEKPSIEKAREYVGSFSFLWNMGYMIWPSGMLTDAYKKYSPESFEILRKISKDEFNGDIVKEYKKITKNSIDYEILEKADKDSFVVVPADVGWNDVGDWGSLKLQLENSKEDNVMLGETSQVILQDAKDVITFSHDPKKKIVVIGLEDIAVIDTKDALLVTSKKSSKEVKKIVEKLQAEDPEYC